MMKAEDRAAARTRAEALPVDLAVDPIYGGGGVVWFTDTVADPSDPTGQTPMPEQAEVARFIRLSDAEAFAHLRSDLPAALDAIDRVHALHSAQTFYRHPDMDEDDGWVDTAQVAIHLARQQHEGEFDADAELALVETKVVCRECYRQVQSANDPWEAPFGETLHPCATVRALDGEQ